MHRFCDQLIEALRTEMQEYGGLLALFEEQQNAILRNDPDSFLDLGTSVHEQVALLGAYRARREELVQSLARSSDQPEHTKLSDLLYEIPEAMRGMVRALIEEVNMLITRTQKRMRQNHMLLARCLASAQESVGSNMVSTYGNSGQVNHLFTGARTLIA